MKEKSKLASICRHEPMVVSWVTVFKEQTCRKCGKHFVYRNHKLLFALSLVIVAVISLLTVILAKAILYRLSLLDDRIIGLFVVPILIILAKYAIQFVTRKVYAIWGIIDET